MEYGPGPPTPPRNKTKARPSWLYPVNRAPKHDNPSGTLRELEAVQFNVGYNYVKPGLKHPPAPPQKAFTVLPPVQKTTDTTLAPPGHSYGGSVEMGESDEHHPMHPFDKAAFYFDAQTLEVRSIRGAFSQVVPVSDVPEGLKFRELDNGQEYNKVFDTITKRYNGVDGLTEEEATHPVRKGWVIIKKCNAIISFDDEAEAATGTTHAAHGSYFGQITKPDGEGNYKPWIKLEFVMNSQHPAIAIVLQEEGQDDVTCYFYANSIQRDLENDEVKFQIRGNEDAGGRHKHIEEVAELCESSNLLQVHMLPWGPDHPRSNDGGIETAQAVFKGIPSARVNELAQFADGNHSNEWNAMSAREKVIALLHRSQNFSVFRYWPSGGAAPVNSLREWMDTAMWATAKYGFHWFYQMQSEIPINDANFPWSDMTVPRWLAKTMAIEFDRVGELVTMRPDEWNQLLVGDRCLFPMQVAGAFAHPFTISYVGEPQSMSTKKACCPRDFRQRGTFKAHPEHRGVFIVAIWRGEWSMGPMYPSPRPAPGTRIVVEVPTPTFERDGTTHKMRGEISENIFRTKAKINAIVRGPARLLDNSHLYSRPVCWGRNDFRIYLQQEDESIIATRHVATVEEPSEGQERTNGLEIPEYLTKKAKKNRKDAQSAGSQKKQKWFRDPRDRGSRGGRGGGVAGG